MNLKLEKSSTYKLYKHFLSDDDNGILANYLGKAQIYHGKTPYEAKKDEEPYQYYHVFIDNDGCYHLVEWALRYDQVYLQILKSGYNVTFLLYNFKQSFVTLDGNPLNKNLDCSYDKNKESQ